MPARESVVCFHPEPAWLEIMKVNAELLPYALRAAGGLRQKLLEAERRAWSEKVRTDRVYFFGLFPEPQLRALRDSVDEREFLTSSHRPIEGSSVSVDHGPDSVGSTDAFRSTGAIMKHLPSPWMERTSGREKSRRCRRTRAR